MTTSAPSTSHQWRFFRAGGFDQVSLDTGADLAHLSELDQKLWVALSCPTKGVEFDRRTLSLIDSDGDEHVRAPELLAALDWAMARLRSPDVLMRGGDLALADLAVSAPAGERLLGAAHRDQGAVAVQIGDRGLAIDIVQGRGVGQVAGEDREEDHQEDQAPDRQNRAPVHDALPRRARGFRARAAATSEVEAGTRHRNLIKPVPVLAGRGARGNGPAQITRL